MHLAYFQFYDELNFFLNRQHRNRVIKHSFDWQASIKDMIESLGVPHPEIELMLVNSTPVSFDYSVQPDDHIQVYPRLPTHETDLPILLRPPFSGVPRFVLDTHLGRLAAYLRMLGFDTLYRNDYPDDKLAHISSIENRILLTRDLGLLKRSIVTYGYFVRETRPRRRLVEIVRRYQLLDHITPLKRCMKCNGVLEPVEKALVIDQLPLQSAQSFDEFHACAACGQLYWKGSHYDRMTELINKIREID